MKTLPSESIWMYTGLLTNYLKRGWVAALMAFALIRAQAQPANDSFTNAIAITHYPATVSGNNFGATIEPGEFASTGYPVESSVWYRWTAPFTGRIGIADAGSPNYPYLKVCVGTNLASLTNLISEQLYVFHVLQVIEGTTYYFDIDQNMSSPEGGPFQFRLVSFPTNDNFSDALTLTGNMLETFADNRFATAEPGEPNYTSGYPPGSIWWNWTPLESGVYRITGGPRVDIFTGESVTNLTLVTFGHFGWTDLNAVTGVVYRIRMTSGTETARLAIYPPAPPNDNFENRMPLSGAQVDQFGSTFGATAQTQDPAISPFATGYTVWYSWTALASGRLTISASGLLVGVFTGDQLGTLQRVGGYWDAASPEVKAGQTYAVQVDGPPGEFRLKWDLIPHPTNDNFTNRLVLTSSTPIVTNSNFAATIERGERIPKGVIANASIWYEWAAQTNGLVRMLAEGDGFVPTISVYQGKSVNKLKTVANSLGMTETVQVLCSFNAKAGQTYVISLNGLNADSRGKIVFQIDLTTLKITNPIVGTSISAANPPPFQVNIPLGSVDGALKSVEYLAVQSNGQYRSLGLATDPPFAVVPTNLPAGVIVLLAVGVNEDGLERVSVPVAVKVRPVNDDFAQRRQLEGYQWSASGTTAQASRERGEPKHGKYGTRGSVWWSWTAPATGEMSLLAAIGSDDKAVKRSLAVYTGTNVAKLKRAAWNTGQLSDSFHAVAGTTYQIAVGISNPNADQGFWDFNLQGRLQTISFVHPSGGFQEPVDVPIVIATSEDNALVDRVSYYASDGFTNDMLIGSISLPPYGMVWSNAPSGNFNLRAEMTKTDGNDPLPVNTQFSVRPSNDNFTNAAVLHTNFAMLTRRIAGATGEPGEPRHDQTLEGQPSLWWSWTAPANGRLFIGEPVVGNNPPTVAVYEGTSLTNLQLIVNNHGRLYIPDEVRFDTSAGRTYQIAVATAYRAAVDMRFRFYTPPGNDHFTNRTSVSGSLQTLKGHTVMATREPNEPFHAGFNNSHTIWWSWTAPANGSVTLASQVGIWLIAGVYTGDSLGSLSNVASSGSIATPLMFEVQAGVTYQIAIASYWGDEEDVAVGLEFQATPAYDQFTARLSLEGTNLTFIADNRGTGVEAGEPPLPPGAGGRTLWWSWTAPANGMFYLRATTSYQLPRGTMMLEVFTGDSLAGLSLLSGGGGDQLHFHVVSNQTYQIRFDAIAPVPYGVPVKLDFIAAPPNDDFANATVLNGVNISTNGTLRGSSSETNDPLVWTGDNDTVWYSWIAPQNGSVIIASAEKAVQAFTGSNLANLAVAGVRRQGNSVLLNAIAGTTYRLAVAGFHIWEPDWPDKGPFNLLIMTGDVPANDNFANSQLLTGTSAMIVATNWVASLEPNDPPIVNWFNLQRTLWYQWRAPASGLLVLTNAGSEVDPVMGVYLGTNLNQLWMIGNGETPVRSNETVHILVDGRGGAGGVIRLSLSFLPAPANDDLEQAIPITDASCTLTGNVRTATGQSSVPGDRFRYDYRDAWWRWFAPGNGNVVITNLQMDATPAVRVYTGDIPDDLELVTWLSDGSLQFDAVKAVTYWIQATWGSGTNADNVNLNLTEILDTPPSAFQTVVSQTSASTQLVPSNTLKIISPRMLTDGRFAFRVVGTIGTIYQLEYSTDLSRWQVLKTGMLTNDTEKVVDTEAGSAAARFYRIR